MVRGVVPRGLMRTDSSRVCTGKEAIWRRKLREIRERSCQLMGIGQTGKTLMVGGFNSKQKHFVVGPLFKRQSMEIWTLLCVDCLTSKQHNNNNNNNNNDFISKALFHVKHAQLRCTMPMNNTHTHTHTHARARARASKTSYERTIAYKSLKHNTIC